MNDLQVFPVIYPWLTTSAINELSLVGSRLTFELLIPRSSPLTSHDHKIRQEKEKFRNAVYLLLQRIFLIGEMILNSNTLLIVCTLCIPSSSIVLATTTRDLFRFDWSIDCWIILRPRSHCPCACAHLCRCTPNVMQSQSIDYEEYYTNRDPALLVSNFTTNLAFLTNNWRHMLGRPTITLISGHYLLGKSKEQFRPMTSSL